MNRQKTTLAALTLVALGAMTSSSCKHADTATTPPGDGSCATNEDDQIRLALAPTCEACHAAGSNRPMFADLVSFENLLVYDPTVIVPGNADTSPLIALLTGTAQGTYTQMPLTGQPFAQLAEAGQTQISLADIKSWINNLPPPDASAAAPSPDAPTTRRLRAVEIVYSLQTALGFPVLGPTDASYAGPPSLKLWVRDPDAAAVTPTSKGVYTDGFGPETWANLGGGDSLQRIPDSSVMDPGTLRVIAQMSLEWCTSAVSTGGTTFFHDAAVTDTSAVAPAKIQANIGYLYLRFLGEAAASDDVNAFFSEVFVPAEPRGSAVAWAEVCAALVRDPRFLTF